MRAGEGRMNSVITQQTRQSGVSSSSDGVDEADLPDRSQCIATVHAGRRCRNAALDGQELCAVHLHGMNRFVDGDPDLHREADAAPRAHHDARTALDVARESLIRVVGRLRKTGRGYDRVVSAVWLTRA